MSKTRLEAFSDGVFAILITIMVLELKTPVGESWESLRPVRPVFLAYVLSFVNLCIYWNNHHHMFHVVDRVNGSVQWANSHLLFWLSLIPFVTAWLGEYPRSALPTALYGCVQIGAAIGYTILVETLLAHGHNPRLAEAVRGYVKGWISLAMYAIAIGVAFVSTRIADALYVTVALMWLIPDRQIERMFD